MSTIQSMRPVSSYEYYWSGQSPVPKRVKRPGQSPVMSTDDRYESPCISLQIWVPRYQSSNVSPQKWVARYESSDISPQILVLRYQSSDMSPRIWVLWVLTGQIWADMCESPDMSSHIWVLKYQSSDMSPQIWVSRYVRVPRYESWLLRYQSSDIPRRLMCGVRVWVVTPRHRYISDYANEGESPVWVHRATHACGMHHVRMP